MVTIKVMTKASKLYFTIYIKKSCDITKYGGL